MRYIKSFDGLRALAVVSVLFYHAGMPQALGGFQGVTVFFVLSGYLITSLLLKEYDETDRIHLGRFWYRRVKRLFPAMLVVLIVLNIVVPLIDPVSTERLRTDTLTSLFYVTNWGFIVQNLSYFESFDTTNYLTHFWSLAIEEQYYVIWAILIAWLLPKSKGRTALVRIAFWGAVISAGWMMLLYHPEQDPSRVYYGTDSRLFSILIGSLFAFGLPLHRLRDGVGKKAERWLAVVSTTGLVVFLSFVLFTHAYSGFTYRGGTLVLSLVTACWVVALASPHRTWVDRLLSGRIMRWIGTRSYGIYLYHYPIFAWGDHSFSWTTFLLLSGATCLVAECSFRWIETPIRNRTIPLRKVLAFAVVVVPVLLLVPVHTPAPKEAPNPPLAIRPLPTYLEVVATTNEPPSTVPVTLIGDSVSIDPTPDLSKELPGIVVDAAVGRQMWETVDIVERLKTSGSLGQIVIIELGNNGAFHQSSLNKALDAIGNNRDVYVVNTSVPRPWRPVVNEALAKAAKKHPNVQVIDWHRFSKNQPFFREDDVHLTPEGGKAYAAFIASELKKDL